MRRYSVKLKNGFPKKVCSLKKIQRKKEALLPSNTVHQNRTNNQFSTNSCNFKLNVAYKIKRGYMLARADVGE